MGTMRGLFATLVVCASVRHAVAQPVDPDTKARADAAYTEGSVAYNASDFSRAALKFEEAYTLVPDPAFLFNIGQAYRQAQECVKAADAFHKFIQLVPDAPNVDKAKGLLKEVNVCALFVEGRRLMGAGRPAEACEKFDAAYQADPAAVGTLLNLGLCHEQTGKLATAIVWFRRAQQRSVEMKSPEAEDQAKQRIAGITAKVPKVDIVLAPAVPNATVKLDGKPLTSLVGIEVDPGRHVIEVEAPKMRPASAPFEIAIGAKASVKVPIVSTDGERRSSGNLPFILGGAGVALWTGAAVLGFVGKSKYDDATTYDEQRDWKSIVRYGSTSMFILGTAAVTTSVVLYIRGRRGRAETQAVAPVVTTEQIGISYGGSF
jgi:Tfp pilus assembly protein PilF